MGVRPHADSRRPRQAMLCRNDGGDSRHPRCRGDATPALERPRTTVVGRMSPEMLDVALTGLNVSRELREAIIGDMVEERVELAAARGDRFANWWMASQLLRSAPILARAALREEGENGWARATLRTVGAALLAFGIILV